MNTQKFEHSQLFAGEVRDIVRVKVADAVVREGDLLVSVDGSFVVAEEIKSEASDVVVYAIAGENVGDEGTPYSGEIVAYRNGYFDISKVRFNGDPIETNSMDAQRVILMKDGIYLVHTN